MSDESREGAKWLIRLTEAVEATEGDVRMSTILKIGITMTGLEFLQQLAKDGIFVVYDPQKDKIDLGPQIHDLSDNVLVRMADDLGSTNHAAACNELVRRAKIVGMSYEEIDRYETWKEMVKEMQRRASFPNKEPSAIYVLVSRKGKGSRYLTHQGGASPYLIEARKYDDYERTLSDSMKNQPPDGWPTYKVMEIDPLDLEDK